MLALLVFGSLALNVLLVSLLVMTSRDPGGEPGPRIGERFYSGEVSARDKIAVVRVDGPRRLIW